MKPHIFLILLLIPLAHAYSGGFDIGLTIGCDPSWSCTAYSEGDCGTRTCIDTNACGTEDGKPTEEIPCTPSGGGSSGGGGGGGGFITTLPYELSTDILNYAGTPNETLRKAFTITANKNIRLTIAVKGNTSPPVTFSDKELILETGMKRKVTATINTNDFPLGSSQFQIRITQEHFVKDITAFVLINEKIEEEPEITTFELKLTEVQPEKISFALAFPQEKNVSLNYTITNADGEIIYEQNEEETVNQLFKKTIHLPRELLPGYYLLSVSILDPEQVFTQHKAFGIINHEYTAYIPPPLAPPPHFPLLEIIIGTMAFLIIVGLILKTTLPPKRKTPLEKSLKQGYITLQEYENIILKKAYEKQASPGQAFILKNGSFIYSIHDLYKTIQEMDKITFSHYIGPHKNEFAHWVENIFQERTLAEKMRLAHTRETLLDVLKNHARSTWKE